MCCCLTAKDKGEKKLFGYSFVPLMQEDGRTLPDGIHELIIHKVKNSNEIAACPHSHDLTRETQNSNRISPWQYICLLIFGSSSIYFFLCLLVICSLKALDWLNCFAQVLPRVLQRRSYVPYIIMRVISSKWQTELVCLIQFCAAGWQTAHIAPLQTYPLHNVHIYISESWRASICSRIIITFIFFISPRLIYFIAYFEVLHF